MKHPQEMINAVNEFALSEFTEVDLVNISFIRGLLRRNRLVPEEQIEILTSIYRRVTGDREK